MIILERILDFIARFWDILNPIVVVKEFEAGVILKLGKFNRVLGKGLHFKIPILESSIVQRITVVTNPVMQNIITKDYINIEVETTTKYNISNAKKCFLNVEDPFEVIDDVVKANAMYVISKLTFRKLLKESEKVDFDITIKSQREMDYYGIKIESVRVSSLRQNNMEILFKNLNFFFNTIFLFSLTFTFFNIICSFFYFYIIINISIFIINHRRT